MRCNVRWMFLLLPLLASVVTFSCDGLQQATLCIRSSTRNCACQDGRSGTQQCNEGGDTWGICVCQPLEGFDEEKMTESPSTEFAEEEQNTENPPDGGGADTP